MSSYPNSSSKSHGYFERAQKVLSGGNSRLTTYQQPYIIYGKHGDGCHITDVDNVTRIDFLNNYTSLLHGHCHPKIVEAIRKQAGNLISIALGTFEELKYAELLCDRVEAFDQIRFMNSGTEAMMQAIRAARAYTGRPMIAKCEGAYHGAYDFAEVTYGTTPDVWGKGDPEPTPYANGTPKAVAENVKIIPFNDIDSIERILGPHATELAAIALDLVPLSLGTILVDTEFLTAIRQFADKHGILVICDEVVTFRLGQQGAHKFFGIDPDLIALGKIIGGGIPIGAVAGKREYMSVFDPSNGRPLLPHGGTFNGNPMAMAAGYAALSIWTPEEIERLNQLGDLARNKLTDALNSAGVAGQVTGMGTLFQLHLNNHPIHDYRSFYRSSEEQEMHAQLHRFFLNNGILINPGGIGAISTPMCEEEIETLADVTYEGLRQLNFGAT
ncbi:MAG: aminotransferase class III-fold pyridoxal phosphate-dependent enzyme [Rhodospirillales bacterium]|jgi:glutamate-1-semialdehyde 2,1-aminomutase|nr:aminotransferase class III-fold pyridoxal phosphate-dependent enzyme [Rhodospirillales bacterium]